MAPGNVVRKLLALLGACAWMGAAACGGSGTQISDALIGSGGQTSGGALGSGGVIGSGGAIGSNGGSTGKVDASLWDASSAACGKPGTTCAAGQFCDLVSKCGAISRPEGTCEATGPGVACTKEYRPVCGCNGVAYDNDCLRRAAGILKLQDGLCGSAPDGSMGGQPGYDGSLGGAGATGTGGVSGSDGSTGTPPAPTYAGCLWSGGLDHIKLSKRDLARDQCIVLNLSAPGSSRAGYTVTMPNRFGLVSASIAPCNGDGPTVIPTSATGTITWSETVYPPTAADVDVVLGVTSVDGGPTTTYVFSARDVELASGC